MTLNGSPDTPPRQCKATTATGKRCRGQAYKGESLCFIHSPTHREAVEAGRKAGAKKLWDQIRRADLTDLDLSSPAGVEAALEKFAVALAQGRVKESTARTFAGLVSKLAEIRDLRKIQDELDKREDSQ